MLGSFPLFGKATDYRNCLRTCLKQEPRNPESSKFGISTGAKRSEVLLKMHTEERVLKPFLSTKKAFISSLKGTHEQNSIVERSAFLRGG
jgi:hypothetical protein